MKKIFKWQKTDFKEVVRYIETYKKLCKGELPTGKIISLVFDISPQRSWEYLKRYKELNKI